MLLAREVCVRGKCLLEDYSPPLLVFGAIAGSSTRRESGYQKGAPLFFGATLRTCTREPFSLAGLTPGIFEFSPLGHNPKGHLGRGGRKKRLYWRNNTISFDLLPMVFCRLGPKELLEKSRAAPARPN